MYVQLLAKTVRHVYMYIPLVESQIYVYYALKYSEIDIAKNSIFIDYNDIHPRNLWLCIYWHIYKPTLHAL
jgi:hypothetical protein